MRALVVIALLANTAVACPYDGERPPLIYPGDQRCLPPHPTVYAWADWRQADQFAARSDGLVVGANLRAQLSVQAIELNIAEGALDIEATNRWGTASYSFDVRSTCRPSHVVRSVTADRYGERVIDSDAVLYRVEVAGDVFMMHPQPLPRDWQGARVVGLFTDGTEALLYEIPIEPPHVLHAPAPRWPWIVALGLCMVLASLLRAAGNETATARDH